MPETVIIAAVGRDGAIGREGGLVWRISADMRRFRALTMGHPLVMGRHTFESLPGALPGRRNIVVTSDASYAAAGAETAPSLQAALAMASGAERVMVIGGGSVYAQAMPLADTLEITLVDADAPDADTHFPAIDPAVWERVEESAPATDERLGVNYRYITYRRRAATR